jgi:hypothetical protein
MLSNLIEAYDCPARSNVTDSHCCNSAKLQFDGLACSQYKVEEMCLLASACLYVRKQNSRITVLIFTEIYREFYYNLLIFSNFG